MTDNQIGLLMFLFALVYIAAAPIAIIWSLNILFGLEIAFTWKTWSAVVMLWTLSKSPPRSEAQ